MTIVDKPRYCADTARFVLPLTVVLVLECCLPNVTLSSPCRRTLKVSRRRLLCFPNGYHLFGHVNMLKNNAFVGNTGHFDNEIKLAGSEGLEA